MDAMLFSPLRIRDVIIRNRVVLSPMLQYSASRGYVNDWHLSHLAKFAAGGAGLVFMESTKIESRGCSTPNDAGIWKDDFIESLARIAALIKRNGAAAGIQLGHSGRKARRAVPWEGRVPLTHSPGVDHGEEWELIGPSPVAHSERSAVPREMSHADIAEVALAWGKAAQRADKAGFDVIEIHGGHGYLIHQFLSPASNRRSDAYGGSLENRMRFALEVTSQVRRNWPEGKPLFFRVSSVDEAGWEMDDTVALATALKPAGVDVIDCSSGGMSEVYLSETPSPLGYQVPYAERVRKDADITTMAVGMIIYADQAEAILREGKADLIALGREFLHNPHWPLDAAQKLGIEAPFAHVARPYAYWLEKRWRSNFGTPSTWQRGIAHAPGQKK